tara:strand:- start:367 stop:489 length:123 start_codon:yes stop_codon:yes gene_type:complete
MVLVMEHMVVLEELDLVAPLVEVVEHPLFLNQPLMVLISH